MQLPSSSVRPSSPTPVSPAPLPAAPTPSAQTPPASAPVSSGPVAQDRIQASAPSPAGLGTPPIHGQLALKLSDRDGLLVNSQNDLSASLNGEFAVQPEFILAQLADLPLGQDIRLKPPRFDASRQQYVLSGKALDVLLGMINVGFEVRLGTQNGQMAFRVDNAIKRGIIYKQLAKQLAKLGLETERQDHQLLVKPSYTKPINLPIGKDGQQARLDGLSSSAQQLSFRIDAQGQLLISLKDVQVALSSDAHTPGSAAADGPDQLELALDVSLDKQLNPQISLRDGSLSTTGDKLAPVLKGPVAGHIREHLGSNPQISLSHLQGEVDLADGLALDLQADVAITGSDGAQIKAEVGGTLQRPKASDAPTEPPAPGQTRLRAADIELRSRSGQQLSAERLSYADGQLSVSDLDGALQHAGVEATLTDVDVTLQSGAGTLQVTADGQIAGKVSRDGMTGSFATSGQHSLDLKADQIAVQVETADITGNITQLPVKAAEDKSSQAEPKPARPLTVEVAHLSARAELQMKDMQVGAEIHSAHTTVSTHHGLTIESNGPLALHAKGERVNADVKAAAASVSVGPDGTLSARLRDHQSSGSFQSKGKVHVAGAVSGDLQLDISADKVVAQNSAGQFDARFRSGDKIKVAGTGGDARLELRNGDDVDLSVSDLDVTTTVTAGNARVKARTRGRSASVQVAGDDVRVSTAGTRSDLGLGVKKNVKATGQTGDVRLAIEGGERETIQIQAADAKVSAQIGNAKGTLAVTAQTQGDLRVGLDGDDVTLASDKAQTQVDMQLKDKVAVGATGRDFSVKIAGDDLNIGLEGAEFKGAVTPNDKLRVDARSSAPADLRFTLDEREAGSRIDVSTQGPVAGNFSVKGKVDADFQHPQGFALSVDDAASEVIRVDVGQLGVQGRVNTPKALADVAGQGDFSLEIRDGDQIAIGYDGELAGDADLPGTLQGNYRLAGQVDVALDKQDLAIRSRAQLGAATQATRFGAQGRAQIDSREQPLSVSLKNQQLQLDLPAGAEVQLQQLQDLKLGDDPKLKGLLDKLESAQVDLHLEGVQVTGADTAFRLRSGAIETTYGSVDVSLAARHNAAGLSVSGGQLNFTPDMDFYTLLRDTLSQKFNIQITGHPRFENGAIHFDGEARSRSGLTQLARFEMKTTVVDNKLVFDLEKARVLNVIGTNTAGRLINHLLSKTDIDVFRRSSGDMEIALADIVKDLSLTQGVNFTDLKLVGNRFEVGFGFSSQDADVARLAKADDLTGLSALLARQPLSAFSGESLSTAFAAYAKAQDSGAAAALLERTARTYAAQAEAGGPVHELARALDWMARSQPAVKHDLNDNIALAVGQALKPATRSGQDLIRALPRSFVETLANNLDQTLSQGGGMSWITPTERSLANQLRRLHGLPENKRGI
ncbi:MAG: hypothetical protein ACO1RX_14515 [Candidatus Sericytochromatia bacterium]